MPDVHHSDPILQLLEAQGLVTADQLQEITDEHQRSGKPVREIVTILVTISRTGLPLR